MSMSVSRPSPARRLPLAVFLRDIRESREMPVEEAAARAGLAVEQWQALEAGEWIPISWDTSRAICRALDVAHKYYTLLAIVSSGVQAQVKV